MNQKGEAALVVPRCCFHLNLNFSEWRRRILKCNYQLENKGACCDWKSAGLWAPSSVLMEFLRIQHFFHFFPHATQFSHWWSQRKRPFASISGWIRLLMEREKNGKRSFAALCEYGDEPPSFTSAKRLLILFQRAVRNAVQHDSRLVGAFIKKI